MAAPDEPAGALDGDTILAVDLEVGAWRYEYALALGYTPDEAIGIAQRREISLHELERLIRRGCSPARALDIVS